MTTLQLCTLTLLQLGFAGTARAKPAADTDLELRHATPATSFNVVLVALPSFASFPLRLAGLVLYVWHHLRVGGGGFVPRADKWTRMDGTAVARRHRHPDRVYLAARIYTVVSGSSANNQWERTHGHV